MFLTSPNEIVYQYVKEGAPVLFLLVNNEEEIIDANYYAFKIIGQDILDKKFSEIFIDFKEKLDLEKLSADSSKSFMLNVNTTTGLPQTFFFNFYKGVEETLILGKLDITEQEKLRKEILTLNSELNNLTRELQKSNIELKRLNELKNHFLGMAAHDLRNPLGLIMNYSEFLLLTNRELNEKSKSFIENILSASELMKELIDDFLDVSIIESGQFPIDKNRTDLINLLIEGINRLEFKSKKKDVLIEFNCDVNNVILDIDGPKISQVFANLLSNAIEYSFPKSKVHVNCHKDQNNIIISVKDEGQGISESEQAKLFKFFGKASTKKTGGEKSTGLGLAIAKKIIESHKGKIWVESKMGEGAKFIFSIPMGED